VAGGGIPADAAAEAITEIVDQEDPALRRTWEDLTPLQQRVLQALAAGEEGVHAQAVRTRYELGSSSSVGTALDALVSRSILVRMGSRPTFDNPYFREWVRRATSR
jgi:hypothetical protein